MQRRTITVRARCLHSDEDRASYWLSLPTRDRTHGVGVINLTVDDERYAEQEFPRVYRVVKRRRR